MDSIERTMADALGQDNAPRIMPQKVFARPFRLLFKKTKTDEDTWIEVRSLKGLKEVGRRLQEGEIEETSRMNSLEMQLWGLLAEHSGFLQVKVSASSFGDGLQPLGAEAAALADDMVELFGGEEKALEGLAEMRRIAGGAKVVSDRAKLQAEKKPREPGEPNPNLSEDGVLLSNQGVETLEKIVASMGVALRQEEMSEKLKGLAEDNEDKAEIEKLQAQADLGEKLLAETPPEDFIAGMAEHAKKALAGELETTGQRAAEIGGLVEAAGPTRGILSEKVDEPTEDEPEVE